MKKDRKEGMIAIPFKYTNNYIKGESLCILFFKLKSKINKIMKHL